MSKWMRAGVTKAAIAAFLIATVMGSSALAQQIPGHRNGQSTTAPPGSGAAQPLPQGAMPQAAPAGVGVPDYVLGIGDKLEITVFGEEDLSGEFLVSSTGTVSLPLIGEVKAAGETISQVQSTITNKLSSGYMKDPHVSLQVMTYRPFFIVGEVMKPGSYNFVNGMSVINAVALAGGYTYRADKDDIKLQHGGPNSKEEHAQENSTVVPGDVITIPERFF